MYAALQTIQSLPDWEFLGLLIVSMWTVQALVFYTILALMWG